MSNTIVRTALFSDCRRYRYALWRCWDSQWKQVLFIGLNPSTADEQVDDPTIRRCTGYARSWGYGGFCIANIYAFCHPFPKELFRAEDPVGADNDFHLKRLIDSHDKVVLIWGNHAARSGRFRKVLKWIREPYCLQVNKSGQPAHPLYLKKGLQPKLYDNGNTDQ